MYPAISAHRMPYDIDGTEVGRRSTDSLANLFSKGVSAWLTSQQKGNLNREDRIEEFGGGAFNSPSWGFWFFFPELREVTHIGFLWSKTDANECLVQGSTDSTNGMDGTWETAVFVFPSPTVGFDFWRSTIMAVSFSGPVKVLRVGCRRNDYNVNVNIYGLHVYGQKYATETPDDIVFCNASTGNQLTALMDWGDRPEGTTLIDSFKVKNASASKIANNINLQLNHDDFLLAWSADGPWTSVLDIATLGVGALSNTVYVRNKLEPPLLLLGPKAARVIVSVGSWT